MAGLSLNRPAEAVLAARVARYYYLEDVSKVEIADRLRISRFRVARLLTAARESGMVRIEIGLPGGRLDVGLSAELCSAFGLEHAFVFDLPDRDEPALRSRLGEAAGQALMDIIGPDDVLGMTWARSLSGLAASLTRFPPCPIVQLTGAVPPPDGNDLLTLVRAVARIGGGAAHVFYAPMLLADPESAAAIRRQPDVAAAFALVPSVTVAILSIGAWGAGLSTVYDAISVTERAAMQRGGVHFELAGAFYDWDGHPVATALERRMITISAAALARIPTVLALCYGIAKAPAALAALRGGLVSGIVTHTSLARLLLAS
jgi:DNA-binding transcriptional regulator LsrR (DeoR family)